MISSVVFLRREIDLVFPYLDLIKLSIAGIAYFGIIYILSLLTNSLMVSAFIGILGLLVYVIVLGILKFYNDHDFEIIEELIYSNDSDIPDTLDSGLDLSDLDELTPD